MALAKIFIFLIFNFLNYKNTSQKIWGGLGPNGTSTPLFTERSAFSIGTGSVKVRKYSHYLFQFRFVLSGFETYGSGSVKVRQK